MSYNDFLKRVKTIINEYYFNVTSWTRRPVQPSMLSTYATSWGRTAAPWGKRCQMRLMTSSTSLRMASHT